MSEKLEAVVASLNGLSVGELLMVQEQIISKLRHQITTIDNSSIQKPTTKYQARSKLVANFPVDDYGPWPENLSLRREDIYNDDGR